MPETAEIPVVLGSQPDEPPRAIWNADLQIVEIPAPGEHRTSTASRHMQNAKVVATHRICFISNRLLCALGTVLLVVIVVVAAFLGVVLGRGG